MKRYENLEEAMCKELEKLDKKYGTGNAEMSTQDLETARLLYSCLVKADTIAAMDRDGWEEKDASGRSYRRGRDSMGRYVSRDMHPDYDGYSGHYPEWMPPYRY